MQEGVDVYLQVIIALVVPCIMASCVWLCSYAALYCAMQLLLACELCLHLPNVWTCCYQVPFSGLLQHQYEVRIYCG